MIVNGQHTDQINIADRAAQYGDGCFTTMAVHQGEIDHWSAHLTRLQNSCDRLYIAFERWDELTQQVFDIAHNQQNGVIKVIISRGVGGRGYGIAGTDNPSYIITRHDIPAHYSLWQDKGIELNVSSVTLAKQPLLAGLKHLNRLEQVLVKRELEQDAFHDCIVMDTDNQIVETSAGNLFWYIDNAWFTPSLSFSGVEGVMRNHIIDLFKAKGSQIHECRNALDILQEASEVFVCNSLMGVVPVNAIEFNDGHRAYYHSHLSRTLQQEVTAHRA
jgi:4-amino-4-deoxychorismate lyase